MPAGEYAPKDSRDVTLHPNEPGKPSEWRDEEDADGASYHPDDARRLHGRDQREAHGTDHEPAEGAGTPPEGVPQDDEPFTAEEAAEPAQPADRSR